MLELYQTIVKRGTQGKDFGLPVDLPHLCLQALGSDLKSEVVDTSGWNKLSM